MLLRMREQPDNAAIPWLDFNGVLQMVCKRGRVRHLELLHEKLGMPTAWPSDLLQVAVNSLARLCWKRPPNDLTTFHDDQKNKAIWLMKHHPEACTDLAQPCGIVLSDHGHRGFFLKLLAANAVDLRACALYGSRVRDTQLLELLLQKYPTDITRDIVEWCAYQGNVGVIKLLHNHTSELSDGLFTTGTMETAAKQGHLEVVRFLHEHRTERCTARAIDDTAACGHLDVVQFLQENHTERFPRFAFEMAANYGDHGKGDLAMVQYLAEHRPEVIPDPTRWPLDNDTVKYVRSVWAQSAAWSDDPINVLSAAVIQLTDAEAFKKIHAQMHPAGCTGARNLGRRPLLELVIEEQKDEIAAYLVENCEQVRASVDDGALFTAGSDSRPLNLELLDLLMVRRASTERAERDYKNIIRLAAEESNFPFVKALLERGVPCSEEIPVCISE